MVPLAVFGLPLGGMEILIIGVMFVLLFGPLVVGAVVLLVIAGRKRRKPAEPVAPTTSAGWYPDPTSRHGQRYWSGSAWTEHVADGGAQAQDPL